MNGSHSRIFWAAVFATIMWTYVRFGSPALAAGFAMYAFVIGVGEIIDASERKERA